jgi:hypothetical protein
MSDPIPGNDPSAAYDVVPSERWPKDWWTVTCNGIRFGIAPPELRPNATRLILNIAPAWSERNMSTAKEWSRPFDEPVPLPDGGELRTLLDAGRYVDALPRGIHEREEWQTVMEVLPSAVEGREPVSLLRIALTLALQESGPT